MVCVQIFAAASIVEYFLQTKSIELSSFSKPHFVKSAEGISQEEYCSSFGDKPSISDREMLQIISDMNSKEYVEIKTSIAHCSRKFVAGRSISEL